MKNLSAVTAEDVYAAVRLHDELGEAEFLARYRFRRSTRYPLELGGSSYPSKAILGVAHEFATGATLRSEEFTGGLQETVRVLERLGFSVTERGTETVHYVGASGHATYMLLWSPQGYDWNDSDRLEILDATLQGERVGGNWSIYANRKQIAVGDRVFLRKTGKHVPGVIAAGWATSAAYAAEHWDPSQSGEVHYVDIAWDSMVDTEDVLGLTQFAEEFPHSVWHAAGGGARVPDDIAVKLEQDWTRHLDAEVREGERAPESFRRLIEREYGLALVRQRRHQRAFRKLLLAKREHRCAYDMCGIDELAILEAAHIMPDSEDGAPTLENGLLMCRNHHRAMDAELLTFDGAEFHWADGVSPF